MSYTVLRVVEHGVLLFEEHERRFARVGPEAVAAFRQFAYGAPLGIHSVTWTGERLETAVRTSVSLFEGIPVRYMRSPYAGEAGPIHKRPVPNPYQAVRLAGTATLLTSEDGTEVYESCTASVVTWDAGRFRIAPRDRPTLLSTAISALTAGGYTREAPVLRHAHVPLALVNAVSGLVVPGLPERDPFPEEARELASAAFLRTARRS